MTYYYQTGTVLPPPQMEPAAAPMPGAHMNDKPGIYGAYNGAYNGSMPVSVTMASQPVMSAQYFQSQMGLAAAHGGLPPTTPGAGQVLAQAPQSHLGPQQPQPGTQITMAAASPYPVSKAGYVPQSHLVATAGLYQGASLAYPQPNVSPAMPTRMTMPNNPYGVPGAAGRSVSPYAAGAPQIAAIPSSTYPGTVISGYAMPGYPPHSQISMVPTLSVGAPGPHHSEPTYSMSMSNQPPPQQNYNPAHGAGILVAQPHPRQTQIIRTAPPQPMQGMPAAFTQPQGPPQAANGGLSSYPPGAVIAASPPGHHIPGLSPAIGAPLVANPTYPGASPFHRGLP